MGRFGIGLGIGERGIGKEQALALGGVCLLVLACASLVAWSLVVRLDAGDELADQQEMLAQLTASVRAKGGPGATAADRAPAAAFLDAATPGLAGAALEAHVARLAGQHATLVSFAVQSQAGADAGEVVRIEANMEISLRALQELLYELEAGTPYVFVESITVRAATPTQPSSNQDAPMRVTVGLRALWHRAAG
jgi:general secretion pathway protein M